MSLRRKAYRVLISTWEALVEAWYMLALASFAVLILFLVAFIFAMAFELASRLVA